MRLQRQVPNQSPAGSAVPPPALSRRRGALEWGCVGEQVRLFVESGGGGREEEAKQLSAAGTDLRRHAGTTQWRRKSVRRNQISE